MSATRTCTKCGETKPQDQFYGKTGRQQSNSRCVICYRAQQNARRRIQRLDPAFRKAEYVKGANTPWARASALHHDIKRRSVKKGLEFSLSKEWIADRLGECAITKVPLQLCRNGTNKTHPFAPSVDRIDSNKGYTPDNCQVVCWMYNAARNYHEHRYVVEFAHHLIRAEAQRTVC